MSPPLERLDGWRRNTSTSRDFVIGEVSLGGHRSCERASWRRRCRKANRPRSGATATDISWSTITPAEGHRPHPAPTGVQLLDLTFPRERQVPSGLRLLCRRKDNSVRILQN